MLKMSAIYCIEDRETKEVYYVGQTNNWGVRRTVHACMLRKEMHGNKKLRDAYSRRGEFFVFRRLEPCPEERLCARETHYKKVLRPTCNLIEPPKRIRRDHPRFNPTIQEIRRQQRQRQRRSTQ
jgi:hypothetical protein